MDDVDEGIGSNDSTASNSETALSNIKSLNSGSKENNCKLSCNTEDDTSGLAGTYDRVNEKEIECLEIKSNMGINGKSSENQSVDDVQDTVVESKKKVEDLSNSCDKETSADTELTKDSNTMAIDDEEYIDLIPDETDDKSNDVNDENKKLSTDSDLPHKLGYTSKDKDKSESKVESSSKLSSHLEVVRKSLKGLMANVKSIEGAKAATCVSPMSEDSSTGGTGNKAHEEPLDDSNNGNRDAIDNQDAEDDLLAVDNDEGISMVIGSDDEDDLLNQSPEPDDKVNDNQIGNRKDDQSKTENIIAETKYNSSESVHCIAEKTSDHSVKDLNDSNILLIDSDQNSQESNPSKTDIPDSKAETTKLMTIDLSDKSTTNLTDLREDKAGMIDETRPKNSGISVVIDDSKTGMSVDDDDDDDDDDVIFEGITKSENVKETPNSDNKRTEQNNIVSGKSESNNPNEDKEDKGSTVSETVETKKAEDETDNDVILEKVEKPDENKSDIKNKDNTTNCDPENSANQANKSPQETKASNRKRRGEELVALLEERCSKKSKTELNGISVNGKKIDEPVSIELSDSEDVEPSVEKKPEVKVEDTKQDLKDNCKVINGSNGGKLITLTEQELSEFVRQKVKTYLASQQNKVISHLNQKIKELQHSNDMWKRKVKDLQVKVSDVTVVQQKVEKRKAATAALRNITTRNVGVQVESGKTVGGCKKKDSTPSKTTSSPQSATSLPFGTPPMGNLSPTTAGTGTIRLPMQHTVNLKHSHILSPPIASMPTPTVKTLLNNSSVQQTVSSMSQLVPTTATPVLLQYPQAFIGQPGKAQTLVTVPAQSIAITQAAVKTTSSKDTTAKTVPPKPSTAKVIDLTDDDESSKTRLVSLPVSVANTAMAQNIMLTSVPGTQLIRGALPAAPPSYQLVLNTPGLRPVTFVSGATSAVPTNIPIQNLTTLSTPTNISPGTSLARAAQAPIPQPSKPVSMHPAPFPAVMSYPELEHLKLLPPKPSLRISRGSQGVILSWDMAYNADNHEVITKYQLYAYQEEASVPASPSLWKKVGEVKALPLPMACTLTQFHVGNKYHFTVRAVDTYNRSGSFSDPGSIHLTPVRTTIPIN